MTIGAAEVRRLIDSGDPDSGLVVYQGRAEVVTAGDLAAGRYRGALSIASRQEVLGMLGRQDLSEQEIDQVAANLDAAFSNLGG